MSGASATGGDAPERPPFFSLPGFFPDALPYALRTTAALLLAYWVAFYAQIPTASSAGITVGIIAQPSAGMALSKAFYRVLGTIVGCLVAIMLAAAFPQDRTMLLLSFSLWMGLCSAIAAILRDFRSYGAAISGYTVAIIAIGGIDDPDGLVLSSLNRTAAVLLGIAAVALVNSLTGGTPALAGLIRKLRTERDRVRTFVLQALGGEPIADDLTLTQHVARITGLQTDATYTAAEQSDGRRRRRGAQVAIGSMLTAISAGRTVAGVLRPETPAPIRAYLEAAAAHLRDGAPMPPVPATAEPFDALLLERTGAILTRMRDAEAGIAVLEGGDAALPPVVLEPTHDLPAAVISGVRTIIAFGLAAAFTVLAGWPGATLLLIQQAAFVGLLGAAPTPAKASVAFILPLAPIALLVGLAEFVVMPLAGGFLPFALIVGGLMFLVALLTRATKLAPFAGAGLIYLTLLLSPSNPETYNLETFLNTTLQVALATIFTLLAFLLILPVSPKRRLYRTVAAIARELRRSATSRTPPLDPAVAQARLYDRLVRALTFLGKPTGARRALLSNLYRLGACDIAFNRARTGLAALGDATPPETREVAREALRERNFGGMLDAARRLLAAPGLWPQPAAQQAVSGLADLAYQEGESQRMTRFYHHMTG